MSCLATQLLIECACLVCCDDLCILHDVAAPDHVVLKTTTQPKLLTMDILVLATMKNAAKCDTQCELQNSVNHQNFERILRSEVFLRACLSQWHLPLSPSGFTLVEACEGGRIASRQSRASGCVAPRAELARLATRELSLPSVAW